MNLENLNYIPFVPQTEWPETRNDSDLWFIFRGKNIIVKSLNSNITIPNFNDFKDIESLLLTKHYLGKLYDIPCFCGELSLESSIIPGFKLISLKECAPLLSKEMFFIAGKSSQILDWNTNFKYCGRCGTPTQLLPNERAKKCPNCNLINYPSISPAIIVAITKGNQILLAHNKSFPDKLYSLVAGFVEPSETLEDCVKREVFEEVGIKIRNIKYFGSQPWPFPNSIMICFFAEYDSGEINVDGIEITKAGWFTQNNHPLLPAPHTVARKMIDSFLF